MTSIIFNYIKEVNKIHYKNKSFFFLNRQDENNNKKGIEFIFKNILHYIKKILFSIYYDIFK